MRKKFEKENEKFIEFWRIEKEKYKTFKKYYFNKLKGLLFITIIMYIIIVIINKNVNYIMTAITFLILDLLAPMFSWFVNEARYKSNIHNDN